MSLTKQLLNRINKANAQKSTGPTSPAGKQRSSMNAVTHNLSGQNLILQPTEVEAYNRMSTAMLIDLKPKSEPESQIALKIIDINFRLNRLTAVENNLFEFGLTQAETNCPHDDRVEVMAAQTRGWIKNSGVYDIIGRYENRLSRQLVMYQKEFERLQAVRCERERLNKNRSHNEIKRDAFDPASLGKLSPRVLAGPGPYRILSYMPSPNELQRRAEAAKLAETGNAADHVAGSAEIPPTNMAA